jgi:hypothetical protein
MRLEIKTAEELRDPELEARWAERREGRQADVLRYVLGAFVERGGPIPVGEIERAFADLTPARVREQLTTLDERDLLLLEEEEVRLAYPFSATPTPFVVRLEDGQERFACCAIDALGIAPMLGTRVVIRSRCHHCGEPLELAVPATGPLGADEVMVWVGRRDAGERRVCTSL